MSLDERVSTLIKRIYCAGHDTEEWDEVLNDVLTHIGAHAGLTTLVDLSCREYNSTKTCGPDQGRLHRASEEYAHLYSTDPTLIWASRNPNARFCDSSLTLPPDQYLTHPFIKWNRDRMRSTHWYVGYTAPEEQLSYSFSVHFPAEQGPGTPQALRLFRMLFEHLDCAMRLAQRPFDPESATPILLLDSGGNVREVSNGAHRALAESDGLSVRGRRLCAELAPEQAILDQALAQAASVIAGGAATRAVKISRPSGKRSWMLTIRPMLSNYGPFGPVKCELLLRLHDGSAHIASLDMVQSIFDLTCRELEVVRLLAEGHSVESLGSHMHISPNTVRTHLRAIFAKTETSRQSELLLLCSSLSQG